MQADVGERDVPRARRTPGRSFAVYVLLVLASALLLLSAFAVWVDRVALNTDVFVETSTELIEDDEIREAVAVRAVDELYASVDVKELIEEQTPENLDSLAGVAAAGARQALYQILDRALRQPALQRLWALSLRESHETLVQVLEEEGPLVTTEEGVVVLDLRPLVLDAAERLGVRSQVEARLPQDAGRIEVLTSDELDTAQNAFRLLNTLAWILPLLALAAFGAAVWIARDKRRAVRNIGLALVAVGLLGLVAANVVGNYVVDSLVADPETRQAAGNAWNILTELLRSSFRWFIPVGVLFVVATWLAGPGRRAVAARRTVAPVLREQRVWAYATLAAIVLVLLVTGPVNDFARVLVVMILAALGVVWIEVTRVQTAREFPDASTSEVASEVRERLAGWWRAATEARSRPPAPRPASGGDLTSQLTSLSELHARGALTDQEYAAAKARVLAGE